MKKILQILITMHILISVGYTDITKKQMDEYWENSRAEHMFVYMKKKIERELFKAVSIKKEDAKPKLLNEINVFINNPKYLREYKDSFISMDASIYTELLEFYNTPVGNKYKKISSKIENMWPIDVRNKYRELIKNNAISKEKLKLIRDIDKEFNLVEIKINNQKEILIQRQILYPEDNITTVAIDRIIKDFRKVTQKYETMVMPVLFQDFSEKELKKILKYASSKILAIEVEYIYKAAMKVRLKSLEDMKYNLEKLVIIRLCQDFPDTRGFIPKYCKKE